jgi:hypothetical protein
MSEENKIPTVNEMKEKALEIANNIPNLKEKHKFMSETRGNIIELSIIIEICFNQLITETGKDMVFDYENKGLYLIRGIRDKEDLPSFKTKSRDMKDLIEKIFPKLDNPSKSNLLDSFYRFEAIRDIFAHVPVNWHSAQLEFKDNLPYKHFFKLEPKWKNVFFALNEFTQLHQWIIDIILNYNRSILLKKEILSLLLLGKSQAEIQKEVEKKKNETTNTNK